MRILVTGAKGFVGSRIMAAIPAIASPSLRKMSDDDIRNLISSTEPDIIIHTAAISDIATCEQYPEASYRANVEIPVAIARTGVKCILFSTDQVYSGHNSEGPYEENDISPANIYAKHKLEMERRVLYVNPDAVLLRATWMYDMPMYGVANRSNFLVKMLTSDELAFSSTQYRGITYVRELARHMEQAINLPGGIYNFGSENNLSMLDTAHWLADALGLRTKLHDAGPRHNLWMCCSKLKQNGIVIKDTVQGLQQCIEDYGLTRQEVAAP